MKAIFVRHGKDDDRYRGGWSGLDLLPEGIRQAEQLAGFLKANRDAFSISKIISSDLPRALSTANVTCAVLGIDVQTESRLREINNGDLAGMLNDTAEEKYPGLYFGSMQMDEPYPNGESPRDFFERIRMWFADFISVCRDSDSDVLVVTHGGVINIVYHLVKGIEWSNRGRSVKADNCGVHVLDVDSMRFEAENRTDFLSHTDSK